MEMKCPAYIKAKIKSRADHASRFLALDSEICDWMEKQGIYLRDPQFRDHIQTGAESICNPYGSMRRLILEIEKYGEEQNEIPQR